MLLRLAGMATMSNKAFRRWMGKTGVRIWFFVIFSLLWTLNNNVLVKTTYPNLFHWPSLFELVSSEKPITKFLELFSRELGFYQFSSENIAEYGYAATLWLFLLRIHPWLFLQVTIAQALGMLASKPPQLDEDSNEKNNNVFKKRQPVHCICIRILTRGDEGARPLLRKAVTAATRLFSEMCLCKKLKVHVVTHTQFLDEVTIRKWYALGATEVKEMVIPSDYKTPNGALFKARNICYWQERGGGVGVDCQEERSWVLSLDEEAEITQSFVKSFIEKVLSEDDQASTKIDYALSLATIDATSAPISFMCKMMEARWVSQYYVFISKMSEMGETQGPLTFHGGAYLVRASTDRRMGNDWGPEISVADDFAIGVKAREEKVQFKFLNGWFIEGTAPTLAGFILQRSRILRGQIYVTHYLPMSYEQKLQQIFRMLTSSFVFPCGHLFLLSFLFWAPIYPAGPRCLVLDLVFWFTMCVQVPNFLFGATYMSLSKKEIIFSIFLSPFMALFVAPFVDAAIALTTLWFVIKDWKSGSVGYAVTQKIGVTKKERKIENKRA